MKDVSKGSDVLRSMTVEGLPRALLKSVVLRVNEIAVTVRMVTSLSTRSQQATSFTVHLQSQFTPSTKGRHAQPNHKFQTNRRPQSCQGTATAQSLHCTCPQPWAMSWPKSPDHHQVLKTYLMPSFHNANIGSFLSVCCEQIVRFVWCSQYVLEPRF